ncbi:MAG: hypothetical protein Q9206_005205 [Seirophora lacunosa]
MGWAFQDKYKIHDELGPLFTLVTPAANEVTVADPEVASAVLGRRKDYVKPAAMYEQLNVFGRNLNTVEGDDWQRHRRLTAPSFNERTSSLVWNEARRQAQDMGTSWFNDGTRGTITTVEDTATLALHVLTCAGFGTSYTFNEGVRKLAPGHEMTYRDSLALCLSNIITFAIIPKRYLSSPFMPRKLRRLGQAVRELQKYMDEMVAKERQADEERPAQTANLMSALVRASDEDTRSKELGHNSKTGLTNDEIFGNIFAYNLAGHETTANTVAFALVLLAAHPHYQEWVRAEIPHPQGIANADYESMFPRLQRCLAVMSNEQLSDQTFISPPQGSFIPWADGPRNCPGQKFSQVEFVAVVATLLSSYTVKPVSHPGQSAEEGRKALMDMVDDSAISAITLQMRHPQEVALQWDAQHSTSQTAVATMAADRLIAGLLSSQALIGFTLATASFTVIILCTVLQQILFRNPNEPPLVFHYVPFIGSTVTYGIDPYKFYFDCQAKYGDVFTFILLGRRVTVYMGKNGNQFILNGKLKDLNAEEIYSVLTTPVFGKDVVYDVPNAKFMEQKKFIKYGFSTEALRSYVPLMQDEINMFLERTTAFKGNSGTLNLPPIMAQITLFTAARSLQGQEVREKLDTTFAKLYHDLDDGFQPINFMLPWMPLPQNRRRDKAQQKMTQIYTDIINTRRAHKHRKDSQDMIWNLMDAVYKDGTPLPDHEIAHMMIALLMAGQHNTSVTSSWILLRLASQPQIIEELYQEQVSMLGDISKPLAYEDLEKLPLMTYTIRETLRLHSPIHSIMRKVKHPMPIESTAMVVPPGNILLATPSAMGRTDRYFPDPLKWDPHRWESMANPEDQEKEKFDYGYGLVFTGADSTYLPFGAGRHRCIGEKYAYLQLTIIVAMMVRTFRFRNVEGKEGRVVGTDYSSMFSRPLEPALVRWERREGKKA